MVINPAVIYIAFNYRAPVYGKTGKRHCNHCPAALLLSLILIISGCDSKSANDATSFTLSGTITSAPGTATDSDVNDAGAPYESNDTPATAQPLPNPVLLGGFVSRTGTREGKFATHGDNIDTYRATLAKGQIVTLFISDHDAENPSGIDLDIELHNTTGFTPGTQPAARSISATAGTETVQVPENGSYYIIIRAIQGASNYLLTTGQPASITDTGLQTDAPFVPGEIIVRFRSSASAASTSRSFSASTGLMKKRGTTDQAMLFTLGDESMRQASVTSTEADGSNHLAELKQKTIETVRELRKRPDIESADLNYIRYPAAIPDDQYYPRQWNYPLINLPQAWDVTTLPGTRNHQVIVAVVDTGVFLAHPDLQANLLTTGYDFISDLSVAADGDGIDNNPDDPGDNATPGGSSFHGTHVAGIIAARSNNATGVTGVTWSTGTRIMPVRVLGRGGGTTYDIIQGVRYAAGLSNDSGTVPPQRADIINLSLGGSGFSRTEQAAYDAARNAGAIIVAAAGNDNTNLPSYPAAYDSVISVSAVTVARQKAPYSNFGPSVDIAAPGGNTAEDSDGDSYYDGILSTLAEDKAGIRKPVYSFAQGTSMATPHVAGVAAILKSLDPELDPDKFSTLLQTGKLTSDLGAPGRDDIFGFGLIDALKSVENINVDLPPIIAIDHSGPLDFGPFVQQLTFSIRNAGGGAFTITTVSDNADWLETEPQMLDGSNGFFTVTVNRTGLVDGLYQATITIETDTASSLTVPVTLQVGERQEKGDTGHHYVILVDPGTMQTTHMVHVDNSNGSYHYQFDPVPEGEYFIIAGTDLDNDGLICDPGEACGGYPTIERLQPVKVYSNMENINFGSNFNITIHALTEGMEQTGTNGFSYNPND